MNGGEAFWIKVLSEDWSGPLRLKVQGRSMWPTLRPGDQVTVEPTAADGLKMGDWVLLRGPGELFLHRFLGFTREGLLLTKGDGHRAPDSPWPPEALLGRAVALSRQGRTVPVSPSSLRERARTGAHRLMAAAWSLLRRVGLLLLLLAAIPTVARAAVTMVEGSFKAIPVGQQAIRVTWETASEVDMLGFDIQRALQEGGAYQSIAYEWAKGDIVGYLYVYTDTTGLVTEQTYYYRLEAEDNSGSEFFGPISATLSLPATATPTPTATPTRTATPTPSPTPAPTSTPSSSSPKPSSTPMPRQPAIQFWADPDHISWGECAVLHWRVEDVRAVYFQGQSVTGHEDRQACPRQTATYVLRVVTDEGEETRQVTVYVQNGASPPSPTSTSTSTSTPRPSTSTPAPPPPTSVPASSSPAPTLTSPPQISGAAPTPTPSPVYTSSPTHVPASSPTPTPTVTASPTRTLSPTRHPAVDGEPSLPCGLLLGLAVAGIGLILLGVWGFWRMRESK